MSRLIDTYIAGGAQFMHPITVLLMVNAGIIGYVVYNLVSQKAINPNWIEAIKHIGGFAAAFGTFGTLVGLFLAFNALEQSAQEIPFQVIMGGLKVALITVLYGLIVFFLSMVGYIVLKLKAAGARPVA